MRVAQRLLPLLEDVLGGPAPLRLRAWDGSSAGPPDGAATVVVHNRRALRRLLWSPNENGLAEAYITGDVDIDGDLRTGLATMWSAFNQGSVRKPTLGAIVVYAALRLIDKNGIDAVLADMRARGQA